MHIAGTGETMQISAYLRVSTDAQAEHGLGLDVQRQAIRRWAREHGHRIVEWHADEGVSGSNGLEHREGLAAALATLRTKTAHGLVVYRLDRLARDLIVQEQLIAEVRRTGVPLFSTSNSEDHYLEDDPDDPSRALIRQVLGAVSQYERAMITLRMASGRKRKAEGGGYAYGSPAYGWEATDGVLIPIPEEQQVIRDIVEAVGTGRSIRGVAEDLNERLVPARRGRWHPSTVARVLKRARLASA
jgi:DNA invertase Pin-like site-specific DNA recombinase